jgi:hypothetical protein
VLKFPLRFSLLAVVCLIGSLILIPLLPCRGQSTTGVGSGSIKIESLDVSAHVAKLVFVLDEETGSSDFHERSTSWIIFKQYGINVSIPIGRADPDWVMIGTNNVTIWHWKLEKTLYIEYQSDVNQFFAFPFERFAIDFHVASNISRWLSASTDISSFSASIDQHDENYNQSSCPYQPEGCPELMRISISISHNSEYRIVVGMLYAILFIIIAIAVVLPAKMGDNIVYPTDRIDFWIRKFIDKQRFSDVDNLLRVRRRLSSWERIINWWLFLIY